MSQFKSFETERLIIRPTNFDDAPFIYELMNSPKWIKNVGQRNINSIDDASNYIKVKMLPQLYKLGYANYTVILKSTGDKLGTCGLYNREGIEGVDIGFAFLPQFEQQGYAFESTSKLCQAAFDKFNLKKLSAITIKENKASQKLIEKLGLQFKKIIHLENDPKDLLLYELKH